MCGFNEHWNLLTEAFSFPKKKKRQTELPSPQVVESRFNEIRTGDGRTSGLNTHMHTHTHKHAHRYMKGKAVEEEVSGN